MRPGARTPEELETLFEDAFVIHDREALAQLFEAGAVLVAADGQREARGGEEIARCAQAMWDGDRTYVADPHRILQARDTALVVAEQSINVVRRGSDGTWRYAIMRLAPVALGYAFVRDDALEKAAESSCTTHGAATAVDACLYLAALLVGAINGADKETLLESGFYTAAETPGITAVAAGSFREKEPPAIRGTGYVVESLEAALWALDRSSTFEEGALLAVNLGNDADTTGAVYGQLAGALYGEESIPAHWVSQLALRETIESYADRLLAFASTAR